MDPAAADWDLIAPLALIKIISLLEEEAINGEKGRKSRVSRKWEFRVSLLIYFHISMTVSVNGECECCVLSVVCCVCVCLSVPNLICVLFVTLSNASNGFGFPHTFKLRALTRTRTRMSPIFGHSLEQLDNNCLSVC